MSKTEQKEINVDQVVRYLSYTFDKATQGLEKAARFIDPKTKKVVKTSTYQLQVDFCYLIDEIQRGPKCLMQKAISDCNNLIEQAINLKAANTKTATEQ